MTDEKLKLFNTSVYDAEVYFYRLCSDPDEIDSLFLRLDASEREKAFKLGASLLRAQFIQSRAHLRGLIADKLGVNPEEVRFAKSVHGKPHISDEHDLKFNLSHSGEICVIAISRSQVIGIDIQFHGSPKAQERLNPKMK